MVARRSPGTLKIIDRRHLFNGALFFLYSESHFPEGNSIRILAHAPTDTTKLHGHQYRTILQQFTLDTSIHTAIVGKDMQKCGPKKANHPSIGELCQACKKQFKEGDYTTLVVLGPGDNEEARKRCLAGDAYNAVALEIHYECCHIA